MDRRQLSNHLRALTRHELTMEREADETAARVYHQRGRSVSEATTELAGGSAPVTAFLPGLRFSGRLLHAAGDLVTLANGGGTRAHLRVGAVPLRIGRATTTPPSSEAAAPGSFVARLRQLELEERTVEVMTLGDLPELRGRLVAVAADHVVLDTGTDRWVLPHAVVAAVVTEPPSAQ